jgi:DNA-binding CsgD family transcriptional regulator
MNKTELKNDLKRLKTEYTFQLDTFSNDRGLLIAMNELELTEQTILLLYAEHQSYRKVAKLLNISHQAIKNEIEKIRKKIKDRIEVIELWY